MAIFTAIVGAIAYAGGFIAASLGFSAAASISFGVAAAKFAVKFAVSAALSLIARALQPKITRPVQEVQAVINQADAPRRVFVGENLTGGIRALFEVKAGILHQIILVSHGKIDGFVAFWVDGVPETVGAGGDIAAGKLAGFLNVQTRDGSALGGDYSNAISDLTIWDVDRKIEGQSTFYVRMSAPPPENFSTIFPKSYNTSLQWVVRGQAIYDPREVLTVYSENAALIIAHFLTHPDGYRLDTVDIDWTNVSAMANVADLPIAQLAGGSAPSLRLWGYWTFDEEPINVLDRMHGSSGIRAYEQQDGTIGLIGGNFGTPACTLTAKDIEMIRSSEAISERDGYNVLRVFHMDASQKYSVTEVDAWQDTARLAIEGEVVKEYYMEMCPNRSQARRLAKQQIHDDNRAKIEIVTNLVGMKARFPRVAGQRHTILIDYRPEDGSGRVIAGEYEVMNHAFNPIDLRCSIELARVDRASEAWTVAEEGAPPTFLPAAETDVTPTLNAELTQRLLAITAGSLQATLEVNVTPIAGRNDIVLESRYRRVGDSFWINMINGEYGSQSGAVEDGVEYEVESRFLGILTNVPQWESVGNITPQVNATPPGAPIDFLASNGTGHVLLSWRNPDAPFANLRIYRSTATLFSGASLVGTTGGVAGQISEFTDATVSAATNYNYWVAAANVSGVEGAAVGPANITTT